MGRLSAAIAAVALASCARAPIVRGSVAGLHQDCSTSACAPGQTCQEWCGVAGCSAGPKMHTCEIRCARDSDCPPPYRCTTIADGPGSVCTEAGEPFPLPPGGSPASPGGSR